MKKLILILFFTSICNAQILKEKEIPLQRNSEKYFSKIENVFTNKGKLIESYITSERYNKVDYSLDRFYTLKREDGVKYELKKNEYPIEIINNKLYTYTENVGKGEREFITYDLNKKELKKDPKTLKLSLSSSAEVLENGDLIISEGGHNGSDWIGLFSSNFEPLHEFKPFNDLSHISYDVNENFIAYVAQIDVDSRIRIALYGSFANKGFIGSKEIKIDQDLILSSVKVVKDKVVVLFSNIKNSNSQLLILDKEFNLIKKISLNERVAYHKIISNNESFYINTSSKISSYEIEKGEKEWEFKKEKKASQKTAKGYRFTATDVYILDKDNLLLVDAIYEDGVDDINDVVLKVFNKGKKEIVQKIKTNTAFKGNLLIKNLKEEVVVFSNKKMLRYEKL